MDGVPDAFVERGEVGVGDLADVEVLDGFLREREEAGAEPVALVLLAVDEAVLVQGAQQPEGGGLVDAEPVGDLSEVGGPLREQGQDAERPVGVGVGSVGVGVGSVGVGVGVGSFPPQAGRSPLNG